MASRLQTLHSRIIYCSSEDPQYPVQELETNTPQSKGWSTAKFCDYPQELILQFIPPNPYVQSYVKLSEIQVIVHQSRVPSRVDLLAFMPGQYDNLQTELPLNNLRFEPLGFMTFDPNEKSNFTVRELKSSYLPDNSRANTVMLLKLLIRGCHQNKLNMFNQASIIAINCLGSTYSATADPTKAVMPPVSTGSRFEEEMQFDLSTHDKLKYLEQAKRQSIAMQDFEKTLRIKQAIDALKAIGVRLNAQEAKKRQALERYDFAGAQRLKEEIDVVRNQVQSMRLQFEGIASASTGVGAAAKSRQEGRKSGMTQRTGSQIMHKMVPVTSEIVMRDRKDWGFPEKDAERMVAQDEINKLLGRTESQSLVPRPVFDQRTISQMTHNYNQAQQIYRQSNNALDEYLLGNSRSSPMQHQMKGNMSPNFHPQRNMPPRDHDDLVIPTHAGGKKQLPPTEFDQYGSGGILQNARVPDKLSEEDMKFAGPLIDVFGDELLRMLHANDWHLREQAITKIEEEITLGAKSKVLGSQDPKQVFVAVFGIISKASQDKIAQVALASMLLAIKLCKAIYPKLNLKNDFDLNRYVEKTCLAMMDKIGDNNSRLREKTEEAALAISSQPSVGTSIIIGCIVSKVAVKKQAANSVKHIFGKLSLLKKAIEIHKVKGVSWEQCIQYAISNLQHSASEIRNQAYAVIFELYIQLGKKIQSELGQLRPSQSEILNKAFSEIDAGNPQAAFASIGLDYRVQKQSSLRNSQRSQLPPADMGSAGGIMPGSPVRQSQVTRQSKENLVAPPACQFCHKRDPAFVNEDAMDLHLFKECVMLSPCPHCEQVVEIPTLRDHMLTECDKKDLLKQCPRCKQVEHEKHFEQHTKDAKCPLNPKDLPICSLCKVDVSTLSKNLQEAWHKHLVIDRCPENPKKG